MKGNEGLKCLFIHPTCCNSRRYTCNMKSEGVSLIFFCIQYSLDRKRCKVTTKQSPFQLFPSGCPDKEVGMGKNNEVAGKFEGNYLPLLSEPVLLRPPVESSRFISSKDLLSNSPSVFRCLIPKL